MARGIEACRLAMARSKSWSKRTSLLQAEEGVHCRGRGCKRKKANEERRKKSRTRATNTASSRGGSGADGDGGGGRGGHARFGGGRRGARARARARARALPRSNPAEAAKKAAAVAAAAAAAKTYTAAEIAAGLAVHDNKITKWKGTRAAAVTQCSSLAAVMAEAERGATEAARALNEATDEPDTSKLSAEEIIAAKHAATEASALQDNFGGCTVQREEQEAAEIHAEKLLSSYATDAAAATIANAAAAATGGADSAASTSTKPDTRAVSEAVAVLVSAGTKVLKACEVALAKATAVSADADDRVKRAERFVAESEALAQDKVKTKERGTCFC